MEIDIPGAGTKAAYEFKIDLIVWKLTTKSVIREIILSLIHI